MTELPEQAANARGAGVQGRNHPTHPTGDDTMTADELKALAQRVMQATEPDREIDALVKAAVYGGAAMLSPFNGQWCIYRAGQEHLDIRIRKTMDCPLNVSHKTWSADAFTASIEAAMTLVPDGWDYGFAWFGPRGSGAQVWPRGERTDPRIIGARAASPACALTAAALLALAAQEAA